MEIVDYARPCMMAEKALKDLHNAMLERDYNAALEHGMKALVEVRMTLAAVRHEKEQQER